MASGGMLCAAMSRLSLLTGPCIRSISTSSIPLLFRSTPCLMAEPLKKKKRIDPAIIKHREERRKKKIERQIKRLERNARQLKPIDELEVPLTLIDQRKERLRKLPALTEDQVEERALLLKAWSKYKHTERLHDVQLVDRVLSSQQRALDELRAESEELYQAAIQTDPQIVPFTAKGPLWTPPIKDFDSPDGEYTDISRKWE